MSIGDDRPSGAPSLIICSTAGSESESNPIAAPDGSRLLASGSTSFRISHGLSKPKGVYPSTSKDRTQGSYSSSESLSHTSQLKNQITVGFFARISSQISILYPSIAFLMYSACTGK